MSSEGAGVRVELIEMIEPLELIELLPWVSRTISSIGCRASELNEVIYLN